MLKYLTGQEILNICHMIGIKTHGWSYPKIQLDDRYRNYFSCDESDSGFKRLLDLKLVESVYITYKGSRFGSNTRLGTGPARKEPLIRKLFMLTEDGHDFLFKILMGMRYSERTSLHDRRNEKFYYFKVREVTK